jgi:hypothetical protein
VATWLTSELGQSRRFWHVRHMSVLRGIPDMVHVPFAPLGPRSSYAGTFPDFVLKFSVAVPRICKRVGVQPTGEADHF